MGIELLIEHENPHAVDAFPIVASEVSRLIGYLHTRNKLACGESALRSFALMTTFRSERSRAENLARTVELAQTLRRHQHLVFALAGHFELAPLWLDDEDARWIPARRELAHEHGLIVVARKGMSAASFDAHLLELLGYESFRQEAVALLGGGDLGVRLSFRDGRRESLGRLSWERLGDAYSRLRFGTAETPFDILGILRPDTRAAGKSFQQLGLSRVPQDWKAKTPTMLRDFFPAPAPSEGDTEKAATEAHFCTHPVALGDSPPARPRRESVSQARLAELITHLATPGSEGHRPAFVVLAGPPLDDVLPDGCRAYELRARLGPHSPGQAGQKTLESLLLLEHTAPHFTVFQDRVLAPVSYQAFAASALALARDAAQPAMVLCDGQRLWLMPTNGGQPEAFGTLLTHESLRRACARLRGRGDHDFELIGVRQPNGWSDAMVLCARSLSF